MEEKEKNVYAEERELLHKQLELLAEKSKESCSYESLSMLTEQMVNIYSTLNPYYGSRFVTSIAIKLSPKTV